jgi:hypothetical protein
MMIEYFEILLWALVVSGVALWVGIAVVVWMLIYGKLSKHRWFRFNLQALFVFATVIVLTAGISVIGHRLYMSQIVIDALDRRVAELTNKR